MGCIGSSSNGKKERNKKTDDRQERDDQSQSQTTSSKVSPRRVVKDVPKVEDRAKETDSNVMPVSSEENRRTKARALTYAELVAATQTFKPEYLLGEGGFGKVYKGRLQDTNEVVAIKKLNRGGCQGVREFLVEVVTLDNAKHPNLVKLIGYCVEGDQRLVVYEYMELGSLEDHLLDLKPNVRVLDWNTRMKIAAGAAKGLEYLHSEMEPPMIYRDMKCANILLGEGYHPKLSDFGLAKVGPTGDQTHVSTRVMGTYGYCAPEYAMTGQLTFKSDIYSFGVVLLEIITGRRAYDSTRSRPEQILVEWARPLFRDRKNFCLMVDPALEGRYPKRGLHQSLSIAAMCIQEQPSMRPKIADIVSALNYLASQRYDPQLDPIQSPSDRGQCSTTPKRD